MADGNVTKIDVNSGRMKQVELDYIKIIENKNLKRVEKIAKIRRNNRLTGLCLGGVVIGIYSYSILAVKQETFLDDFNEPEKEIIRQ